MCVCLCVCLLCVSVKVPTKTRRDSSEMELDVVSCAKLVLGTELWSFAKHKALLSDEPSSLQPRRHFFLLICQKLTNHRLFLSSMYKMNVANSLQMIETWFLLCALWERMHPLEN